MQPYPVGDAAVGKLQLLMQKWQIKRTFRGISKARLRMQSVSWIALASLDDLEHHHPYPECWVKEDLAKATQACTSSFH